MWHHTHALQVKELLELPVGLDASPRGVCDLAAAAVGHMSRVSGLLRCDDMQAAVAQRMRGALAASLAGCSVLELWLLVAMHRLRCALRRRKRKGGESERSGFRVGDELTRLFRDARRFPSARWYPVPRATRTTRESGICPSFKDHFLSARQTSA